MKKVFASAVAAALALSMAVPAFAADTGSINLTADKTNVKAGEEIAVSVSLKGVKEMLALDDVAGTGKLGAGDFSITYDASQVELVVKHDDLMDIDYSFEVDSTVSKLFSASATDIQDGANSKVSIQFFDASATGVGVDFTLGSLAFKVKDGVADGTEIKLGLAYAAGGNSLVTAGASLDPEDKGVTIPNSEVALNGVSVTVGEPTPDSESTTGGTDSDSTTGDTDSDSTTGGTDSDSTTGGSGTTGGGSTTGGSGDNNKTGDAGVLAIGGLMVLAAGATMLTLKKKSK